MLCGNHSAISSNSTSVLPSSSEDSVFSGEHHVFISLFLTCLDQMLDSVSLNLIYNLSFLLSLSNSVVLTSSHTSWLALNYFSIFLKDFSSFSLSSLKNYLLCNLADTRLQTYSPDIPTSQNTKMVSCRNPGLHTISGTLQGHIYCI